MEIKFLIRWKAKYEHQNELGNNIKEMLKKLFNDVRSNVFVFASDNGDTSDVNYELIDKDKQIFLRVFLNYHNDDATAKILSLIRDKIAFGVHRSRYIIICTYDDASLYYCCKLMEPAGRFERHLRELMYNIIVKAFGADWVQKTIPEDLQKRIKADSKGRITREALTDSGFEFLTYHEYIDLLFGERYLNQINEDIFENELSKESLKSLSKDEIDKILIEKYTGNLWDKLFSGNPKLKDFNLDMIKEIGSYRNDIMHHHSMKYTRYNEMLNAFINSDNSMVLAINDIEQKSLFSESQYSAVLSTLRYTLPKILEAIGNLYNPDIYNTFKYESSEIAKAISEISNSQSNDFSKNISSISDAFKEVTANLPDYAEYVKSSKNLSNIIDNYLLNTNVTDEVEKNDSTDNSEMKEDKYLKRDNGS